MTLYEADINGYRGEPDKRVFLKSLPGAKMYVEELSSKEVDGWSNYKETHVCYGENCKLGYVYERKFGEVMECGYRD